MASEPAGTVEPPVPPADPAGGTEEPVLLATKLHPPARRDLLRRQRLVDLLAGADQYRLTLLDAPAGWGKTSLLTDWYGAVSDEPGPAVGWLALDHEDNDAIRFWSYLLGALRAVRPAVGGWASGALRSGSRALFDTVLPSLINDLTAQPDRVTGARRLPRPDRTGGASLAELPAGAPAAAAARGDRHPQRSTAAAGPAARGRRAAGDPRRRPGLHRRGGQSAAQ